MNTATLSAPTRSATPVKRPLPSGSARTTAITYGTYDLFHIGHVRLFQRIKQRFDVLIVAVSTDEFNAVKGKKSIVPFEDRLELVRACRHVDLAIAENGWDQKERDIVAHGADAFVMGSDWSGRFDHLQALCEVVYLPRTDGVSSTDLKLCIRGTAPAGT
jgi:glycerol-3-phosphate cytidylyltransferase